MSLLRLLPLCLMATLLLTACDTLGLSGPDNPEPVARAIDYRTDDLTNMIFALDVPIGVQPVLVGSTARFDAGSDANGRHLKASLSLADGGEVDGLLPPPASGRTYYLLGVAERDKAALGEAQAWLAKQNPAPDVSFAIAPKLCATHQVDAAATVSIVPVSPAQLPFLPLLSMSAAGLPRCI